MSDNQNQGLATKVASLHGGPAAGHQLPIHKSTWPETLCVNLSGGRWPRHYVLLGGGVYEDKGPCAENFHNGARLSRCGCCGGELAGGAHL